MVCLRTGSEFLQHQPAPNPFCCAVLTTILDDQRDLKRKVFDLFKASPDLLPHVEEGLTKGVPGCKACVRMARALLANGHHSAPLQRSIGPWCGGSCGLS